MDIEPIGWVHSSRTEAIDDDWDAVTSSIALDQARFTPASVQGLEAFSHIDVVYVFHLVDASDVHCGARHPRSNPDWPKVGIFAQRARMRPNRLGVTTCSLVAVDGLTLAVAGLDAMDGSPVVDIKPYMTEFAPRTPVRQPAWSRELMSDYWS